MKKTHKYVKTRGQRMALQQVNSQSFVGLPSNKTQKEPTSTQANNTDQA
jgi:hypothetical protein